MYYTAYTQYTLPCTPHMDTPLPTPPPVSPLFSATCFPPTLRHPLHPFSPPPASPSLRPLPHSPPHPTCSRPSAVLPSHLKPVRVSWNWNPSLAATAASILLLTVEASMTHWEGGTCREGGRGGGWRGGRGGQHIGEYKTRVSVIQGVCRKDPGCVQGTLRSPCVGVCGGPCTA